MSDATKAVFLSYARDDAPAARRIAEALRSAGVEVWFDENELRGGEVWDQKIRKQINDCTLFVAIISQHTEARAKGYFRLEWKLAVEQTHLLLDGVPFIVPVVIDDTPESSAAVPQEFMRVQWTRLPGALPTPDLVAHIHRLADGAKTPPVASRNESTVSSGRGRSPPPAEGESAGISRHRLPVAAMVAIAVVMAAVIGAFLWRRGAVPSPAITTDSAPTSPSEARRLVARVWTIWEKQDDATRDDWVLAEQLCQRAVALRPDDVDAFAAQAQVSLAFTIYGYDVSPARYEAARSQAERAVRLEPDSNEAQFARANYYRRMPSTRAEGVRMLRQLVERAPTDQRLLSVLASALRNAGRNEESLIYSDRALALRGSRSPAFGKEEALRNLGRVTEAESVIDELLAVQPTPAGYLKKMVYQFRRGELDQADALLTKIPAPVLLEEWGAAYACQLWLWRREPARIVALLAAVPKDYLQKGGAYSGPKAYLTGVARYLAGQKDAARADWQAALQVVEQRLKEQPNSPDLIGWKATLFARLGETMPAESSLRAYRQLGGSTVVTARILAILGRGEEAIQVILESHTLGPAWYGWAFIRFDPDFDALQNDSRMQAWLEANKPK